MRVDQLLGSVIEGDAISSDAVAIRRMLLADGIESDVYIGEPGPLPRGDVPTRPAKELDGRADALIYHLSIGSELTDRYLSAPGRRIVRYHNVTPARFFEGWDPPMVEQMRRGRAELEGVGPASDLGIGVSEYNRLELEAAGFPRTASLPISPDLDDVDADADPILGAELSKRAESGPIWLFVGRFVPNKCQVDLVKAFAAYLRGSPGPATLLLIGSPFTASYRGAVVQLASDLGVGDSVVVRGPVSRAELVACYRAASVFVCLSEHEGFCLPLIEAFRYGRPVVAYAAAAVPETLAGAGVLLHEKDPVLVAAAVDEVLGNDETRANLQQRAASRLEDLKPELLAERLRSVLSEVLS